MNNYLTRPQRDGMPNRSLVLVARSLGLVAGTSLLGACGGGGSGSSSSHMSSPPPTYSIGGTVSGLTGTVILQNSSADALTISTNGAFAFSDKVAVGSTYSVTVQTQPTGQTCTVAGGTDTVSAAVTSVAVTCISNAAPFSGKWTWVGGSNLVDSIGVYGTLGTAAASNVPGARSSANVWIDSSTNIWLFGGTETFSTQHDQFANDLWRYEPASGQWTWMSGSQAPFGSGTYGTQGTAAPGNVPGARFAANSWTDTAGNLWLFGGFGYDSSGISYYLNDLWSYSTATGLWTWVAGSNVIGARGVYGTQGTPSSMTVPGARQNASSGVDSSHNVWLFGGYGIDSAGVAGILNDLWKYSPATGQWTWISGSNVAGAVGAYGTLGTGAAGNVPGARENAGSWVDASGMVWVFGGDNGNANGTPSLLNDLWKYSPVTGQWTWVTGSQLNGAKGVYGTQGTSAAGNVPGARENAIFWVDSSGRVLLFGGLGQDSSGFLGELNDLWQFSPGSSQWTWIAGPNAADGTGVYGTMGTAASGNTPGGRGSTGFSIDATGHLWMFGGLGFDSTGNVGDLNDLWTL
jgi:N-acetylneuraminic acid mutarotase